MGIAESVRKQFFRQKYRFDLGITYIALLNFALLVITASDKVKPFLGISSTMLFIAVFIVISFFSVWLFGYFLDTVVQSQRMVELENLKRSPVWKRVFDDLEEIKQIMKGERE